MTELFENLLQSARDYFGPGAQALTDAESNYRALFDNVEEGIFRSSAGGRLLEANAAAARILGYDSPGQAVHELTNLAGQLYVDPNQRGIFLRNMDEKGACRIEVEFRRRDGRHVWLRIHGRAVRDASGNILFYEGIFHDVTEARRSEQRERDRAAVLEMIALNSPLPEILSQILKDIERDHPAWKTIVQRLEDNFLYTWAVGSLPAEMAEAMEGTRAAADAGACGEAASLGQTVISSDMCNSIAADLGIKTCWSVPIRAGANDVLGTLCVYHTEAIDPTAADIDALTGQAKLCAIAIEHQLLTERLRDQALRDPLTGVPNRMMLESILRQSLKTGAAAKGVGLLFLNLDGFKVVNDSLGHDAGDVLLQMATARLQTALDTNQTLARVGADQFIVHLPDAIDRNAAELVGKKLLASLQAPFELAHHEIYLTASIGASLFPSDAADAITLQRNANMAMNEAKALGRNRCQFFAPELNARALERLELSSHLRRAIETDELSLQYQPQVDRMGNLVGVEALLRWNSAELGPISPAKFIPLAEEIGMIVPIGNWVLHRACRQAAQWRCQGHAFMRVAVNVSAVQFSQPDFVEQVYQALLANSLDASGLEIELTESLLMRNTMDGAEKLSLLRDMGITTAIDDFGTGYSSLAYLQKLPIDTLKIDRSFVCEIRDPAPSLENDDRYAVIRAITSLAQSLRMKLVAEGVETGVQHQFLLRTGCHTFQGYLFGKPVAASEIDKLLAAPKARLAQSA